MLVKVTSKSFTSSPPNSPCTAIFDPEGFSYDFSFKVPVILKELYRYTVPPPQIKLTVFSKQPPQKKKWMMIGRRVDEFFLFWFKMGFSKDNVTPKSSILIGFSIINHPFWGTPIFGNTQIKAGSVFFQGQNLELFVFRVEKLDSTSWV